ncbi:TetR/AcrR family transcriptional regulator [Solwaraspora sp. WMMD406]|uniref:TetR/AcrR family transcriptional regulator n=1 Tax=Solwaraspora sp. WMMD406 TaxID=3016095 RepID=UPI002415B2EB|nr:TetR/AcrR family transcriptional regulator [Solwaraspora sp. WMMD406]MDG4765953.1 TetR/AcrR family transcriptional regulator [Solwaraspora sp. WMMD406]
MVVFAAQGDPRRSMELLWRRSTAGRSTADEGDAGSGNRPGPRPGLSVEAIVEAAIALADAEGIGALSMRAVGQRLGRSGMALYTYVPGKSELLDLMYDQVHAELPTDYPTVDGWRAALTAWADDLWACYLRHPWVLQVSSARPVLGPHEYALLETAARILGPTGLPARVLWRTIGTVIHFVRGVALTVSQSRLARQVTGSTDDEWWLARSAMLTEVAPDFADHFPTLTRLERAGAFQVDDESVPYLEQEARETFQNGLDVLLAGIQVTVDQSHDALRDATERKSGSLPTE